MGFHIYRSPRDEKLFHKVEWRNSEENIITFGRGTNAWDFDFWLAGDNRHVLAGRFSSLATGIYFVIAANHSLKNITTSPIDDMSALEKVFKEVRPNLKPIPNSRQNHKQIIIGNDVWIGTRATIMGGVKIGNGAVIGANAMVAKDIPPYAIAVGNPARVVKYRFDEETIRKFLAVKWWNWSLEKIADNFPLMNDPEKFLAAHYSPELEEFPEDDFSRQLKTLTGGGFINLFPTSKQQIRCGLRSSETSRKQNWKTLCLSFGSARTLPTITPKL